MKLGSKQLLVGILVVATYTASATSRISLLDKNADIVFSISSVTDVSEAIKHTSFAKLWNDPQFQRALGEHDLEKSIKQSMSKDKSDEEVKLYWEELKMVKGALGLSANISKKQFSLVAEMSKEDYERSLVMDRRLAELERENGAKFSIHKERYQGVDIYGHLYENKKDSNSWQTFIDGTVIMGSSKDWVKQCIALVKRSPISGKKGAAPKVFVSVNIGSLLDQAVQEYEKKIAKMKGQMRNTPGMMPEYSPSKIVDALGLSALKKMTVSVQFNNDSMVFDSFLGIKRPMKGLFTLYDLSPSSTALQMPYAPKSILSYGVGRLNPAAFWRQLPQMLKDALPPQMAQQANATLMGSTAMLGIDPGRDLFANLDTQIVSISFDGQPEPESLYFIRLKNESVLKESLKKMFDPNGMIRLQMGEKFKQEVFRGADLYEFEQGETNGTFAVSAAAGYLVLGSGKAVRQYLRAIDSGNAANKAFYTSALYHKLRKETPAQAMGYSTTDIGKYVKVFLSAMLDNPAIKMAAMNPKSGKENPFPNFDMTKLPSAQYMAKFFGNSFDYIVPTAKGIKSHSVIYYGKNK